MSLMTREEYQLERARINGEIMSTWKQYAAIDKEIAVAKRQLFAIEAEGNELLQAARAAAEELERTVEAYNLDLTKRISLLEEERRELMGGVEL